MQRVGPVRRDLVHFLAPALAFPLGPGIVRRQVLVGRSPVLASVHVDLLVPRQRPSREPAPRAAVSGGMAPSAQQAAAAAGRGDKVIGWKLDRDQRKELLQQFPPKFAEIVADHVTLQVKAARDAPLPDETHGEIVGRIDDGKGVEAMVVSVGGTTDRPDGSTYHITWSLGAGRKARESNDVLAARPWEPFELPMPVRLEPARWR